VAASALRAASASPLLSGGGDTHSGRPCASAAAMVSRGLEHLHTQEDNDGCLTCLTKQLVLSGLTNKQPCQLSQLITSGVGHPLVIVQVYFNG
jgi:hypothetical protein